MGDLTLSSFDAIIQDAWDPKAVWFSTEADTYAAMCAWVERTRGRLRPGRIRDRDLPKKLRDWGERHGIRFKPGSLYSSLNVPVGYMFMIGSGRPREPESVKREDIDSTQEPTRYSEGSLKRDEPRGFISKRARRERMIEGIARHYEGRVEDLARMFVEAKESK